MYVVLQTVKDAEGKFGRQWRPGLHKIPPRLRSRYQGKFARYMAEVMKLELKRAIKTQRFKVTEKWPPLSIDYYQYKQRKNLSLNMWEATSLLVDSITVYRSGSSWVVGIDRRKKYPNTEVRVYMVARYLEYGTTVGGMVRIPPRPLFRPLARYLRKHVADYWKVFMRLEGIK